jgi:hypothetical protein
MGPDQLDELLASIRSEEGPAELDELLETIRSEGKKERGGALALYQGTRGTDLVDEYIDERVVRILGLGQVFDIDYATYLTLLKEKLVQVSMGGGSLAREEQMLLQDEFRRVKGKVGRFKLKAKKAQISGGFGTSPIRVSKEKFYLTSNAVIPKSPSIEKVSEDLKGVQEALDKLLAEIRADNKEEKRQAEIERRNKIRNRRIAREKLLETSQKKVTSIVTKLVSPLRGILDSIFRFLFFGFLSGAVPKLIEWLADPANKEKVDSMFRFLKDFWPAIAGGLFLFFTPFGGFIRTILGTLARFTPALARLILANPKTSLGLGVAAAATELVRRSSNASKDILEERGKADASSKEQADELSKPINIFDTFTRTVLPSASEKNEPIEGRSNGGEILGNGLFQRKITPQTGVKIKGAGPDTQLVALQPGEFVMAKRAVDTYGPRFFMNINDSVGATNIPTFSKGIQFAQSGGMVGGLMGSPTSFMTAPTGGGGGTNALTEQAKTKNLGTYIGDGIQEFLGVTPKRMRSSLPSTDENIRDTVVDAIEIYKSGSGGLMGSPTNNRFGDKLPMSPEPSRKMTLPLKSLMMISDEKSSESSLDTQMSSGVSMNTTAATVRYTDNMMSPTQRITLPPEPPVRSKKPNMTVLPEIVRNSAPQMQASASSSSVPSFSPSQSNDTRQLNFAVYGIEGMN